MIEIAVAIAALVAAGMALFTFRGARAIEARHHVGHFLAQCCWRCRLPVRAGQHRPPRLPVDELTPGRKKLGQVRRGLHAEGQLQWPLDSWVQTWSIRN